MDKKHCAGCHNDFYNHQENADGKRECWLLKDAKLVDRLMIPVDLMPPYKMKSQKVPNCYNRPGYGTVKPEAIGADGYWM